MIAYFWGAVLTALPFLFRYDFIDINTRMLDIRITKEFIFLFFVFLSLLLFGIGKLKCKIKIPVVILGVMTFSIHSQFSMRAYSQFIYFFAGLILFAQLISLWKQKYSRIIKRWVQIVCITQCCAVFAQFYNLDFYKETIRTFLDPDLQKIQTENHKFVDKKIDDQDPIIGTLGNSNLSAALIATTAPSLFVCPLLLIPVIAALVMLKTSAAMIAFIASALMFLSFRIRSDWYRLGTLIGFILIGILTILYGCQRIGYINDSGRFEVWAKTLQLIEFQDIFYGKGLGHFADFFTRTFGLVHHAEFRQIHNEFLEVFYAFGLIGLSCFGYLLLLIRKSRNWAACCLAAILVDSFFNFYFHIPSSALIGIITYVILYSYQQGDNHGIHLH